MSQFIFNCVYGTLDKFGGSEAIITAISDEYPLVKRNREVFVAILFSFYFVVGLASCTQVSEAKNYSFYIHVF